MCETGNKSLAIHLPTDGCAENNPRPETSGLGKRIKVFEIGEVIQLDAERKEFCK
jgi:hypothetical protein